MVAVRPPGPGARATGGCDGANQRPESCKKTTRSNSEWIGSKRIGPAHVESFKQEMICNDGESE